MILGILDSVHRIFLNLGTLYLYTPPPDCLVTYSGVLKQPLPSRQVELVDILREREYQWIKFRG